MSVSELGSRTDRELLAALSLLEPLTADVRELVIEAFETVEYPFGTVIVHEGEPADAMFVVAAGSVRVLVAGDHGEEVALNALTTGAVFGELALLDGGVRSATVRARTPVRLLTLHRSVFGAILRRHPQARAELEHRRERQAVQNFLRLHTPLGTLPPAVLGALAERMESRGALAGGRVLPKPGSLMVVREGRLSSRPDSTAATVQLREGYLLGELSLGEAPAQPETFIATTDALLLTLPSADLSSLLAEHDELRELLDWRRSRLQERPAQLTSEFGERLMPRSQVEAEAPGPTETAAVAADGSGRVRRGFPFVRQVDELDCGAACLAMVCRHWGRRISLTRIRDAAGTSQQGTTLLGLSRGGERLGLRPHAVKTSANRLSELRLPAIAHWEGNHWVVVYRVTDDQVRYADPSRGLRRLARQDAESKLTGYVVTYEPTAAFDEVPESVHATRWFWELIRPHRRWLFRASVLALVAAGLLMLVPVVGQVIVDHAIPARDRARINLLALALLGMLVLTGVVMAAQRWALARTAATVDRSLLNFLTDRLLALPMSWFYSRRIGDIERRLGSVSLIRQFLVASGVTAVTAAAQLLAGLVLMLIYSPLLTLIYVAVAPIYGALVWFSRRWLRPAYDALEEAFGRYQSRQVDAVKGIETVKAMGGEQALQGLIMRQFGELRERMFRADLSGMLFDGSVVLVGFLSLITFLWVGGLEVINRRLTLGALVAFEALVVLANSALATLMTVWDQFQYTDVLMGRMNDVIGPDPEQGSDRSALAQVPAITGEVSIRQVGFAFPSNPDHPILSDVSLEVAPGTHVAIVGRSGAGKTTLVKLLAGLQEPTFGRILYDGVDMSTLDWRQLRRHIGFVVQDSYVFDDTIAANIAFGEPAPDLERVIAAATAAAAHQFIERLPFGYNTKIGDSGLQLSGGQRQRIAIARALYLRPKVLIFDEATSALDTESERAVQQQMQQLLAGRTSFVVAHRLSTVRRADLILVLEDGRIVERGMHEELLDRRGLYHHLAGQQLAL